MDPILTTRGLSFSYGSAPAVADLDLTLERGDVFGFVGPNGAGKTTTIKLLLGLLTPTKGTIEAFGQPMGENRIAILRRIGALVERPALYEHLSADENLQIQCLGHGIGGTRPHRIAEMLDLVDLQQARGKRVAHFSLGMKQRLGVAMALLHEPELLVLDEPANGLDPAGIQDLRLLLRRLSAERGMTVFLSSHILAELEQTVTKVAVIARGKLRYQGTLDALKARRGGRLSLVVDDAEAARKLLEPCGFEVRVQGAESCSVPVEDRESQAAITAALVGGGVRLYQARREEPKLEELFLAMVARDDEEEGR